MTFTPHVEITRFSNSPSQGVLGELRIDGKWMCWTIERPWEMNQPNVSCIPAGDYELRAWESPKFGSTRIIIGGTVGISSGHRTHVLLHTANRASDLQGCIAPGLKIGRIEGQRAVLSSRKALYHIFEELSGKDATLSIGWDLVPDPEK